MKAFQRAAVFSFATLNEVKGISQFLLKRETHASFHLYY